MINEPFYIQTFMLSNKLSDKKLSPNISGPEVIKLFLYSTEHEISTAKTLRCRINLANKCKNARKCWHFNIYEHYTFHAQLN